jgi:hypothetical protein
MSWPKVTAKIVRNSGEVAFRSLGTGDATATAILLGGAGIVCIAMHRRPPCFKSLLDGHKPAMLGDISVGPPSLRPR